MKRAVIMGASSGMGLAVSRLLIADGWHVGVAARRTDKLQILKDEFPDKVEIATIDVTSDDATEKLLTLIEGMGGINLYFHASGIGKQNTALDENIEMRTVATNALGFTRMVDCVFNYFAANQGGHIAAISSIAGTKGLGAAPSYSATKSLQNTYLEALEQLSNMRKLDITFTDIRPGFVATDLLDDGHGYPMLLNTEDVARKIVKAIYAHRHVTVIDWRYAIMTFLWKLIPRCLWIRLNIRTKS